MEDYDVSGCRHKLSSICTGDPDTVPYKAFIVTPVTHGHEVIGCPRVEYGLLGVTIVTVPCLEYVGV